jgi:hypothetical protein
VKPVIPEEPPWESFPGGREREKLARLVGNIVGGVLEDQATVLIGQALQQLALSSLLAGIQPIVGIWLKGVFSRVDVDCRELVEDLLEGPRLQLGMSRGSVVVNWVIGEGELPHCHLVFPGTIEGTKLDGHDKGLKGEGLRGVRLQLDFWCCVYKVR